MKNGLIKIPDPDLQIDFTESLLRIRNEYLQDALMKTVENMGVSQINDELDEMVPGTPLSALARHGLRGELVFPVPCILRANPCLLGYYRLLLGHSKKLFYSGRTGASSFRSMEEDGKVTSGNDPKVRDLCEALIGSCCQLVEGIGLNRLSRGLLDDLTLLTLGPQLRGGANVRRGTKGVFNVFDIIEDIVADAIVESSKREIRIENAAGRSVIIQFASDPDIVIREQMATGFRNIIAIEIKAGTDYSNIHNRIGEAEKSHQKAKTDGFVECWTVYNVRGLDRDTAQRESPSTNRFYDLNELSEGEGEEYGDFRGRILSLTGIRG